MNLDDPKHLEALIDCELKQLPELAAPPSLLPRVLAAIRQRLSIPWYRRAWQTWPRGLQAASLALLVAMLVGISVAALGLREAANLSEPAQNARQWLSGAEVIWNTLTVLVRAAELSARQLGALSIAACIFAGTAAYISCLGLGTAFVRLAVPRR